METIRTNLEVGASTQYTNFDFLGMCVFQGVVIGASADGLYKACCGEKDDAENIEAYFEPMTSNVGYIGRKRLRRLYLEIENSKEMEIDITIDGIPKRTITIPETPYKSYVRVGVGRSLSGNFWNFRVRNTKGGDFSIHTIKCLPTYLHKGRK